MADLQRGTTVALRLLGAAVLGGVLGAVFAITPVAEKIIPPPQARAYPLPHHIPKYEGGVSLRFAMVHDVIHERFARHGKAYYTERNRRARLAIAEERRKQGSAGRPSPDYFAWCDDLGAGLDYLGEHDEAVRMLRAKLREQEALNYQGRDLYTTYANLGTFLIHGNFRKARDGDEAAKERLREGLAFIHKSIDVNPQAHFGREVWQAEVVEYMLAAMENPTILSKFDLIGDKLTSYWDTEWLGSSYWPHNWDTHQGRHAAAFLKAPYSKEKAASIRSSIACVGAEDGWKGVVRTSHQEPVPFDEPTLGIIGMWRLGGGANPHFALTLGEIMVRVGQRYIAWCAYERAVQMKDRFWPDAAIQEQFVTHCRARQAAIEKQLPEPDREQLRPRFEAELAYGQRYQREYQQYEADRIAAGVLIEDPHFYDDFHTQHAAIASPLGEADQYIAVSRVEEISLRIRTVLASMIFFTGLGALLAACIFPR